MRRRTPDDDQASHPALRAFITTSVCPSVRLSVCPFVRPLPLSVCLSHPPCCWFALVFLAQTGVEWQHCTYIAKLGASRTPVVEMRELLLRLAKGKEGKTLNVKVPLLAASFMRLLRLAFEHFRPVYTLLTVAPLQFEARSSRGVQIGAGTFRYHNTNDIDRDVGQLYTDLASSVGIANVVVYCTLATHASRAFVRSIAAKGAMLTSVHGPMSAIAHVLRQVASGIDLTLSAHQASLPRAPSLHRHRGLPTIHCIAHLP